MKTKARAKFKASRARRQAMLSERAVVSMPGRSVWLVAFVVAVVLVAWATLANSAACVRPVVKKEWSVIFPGAATIYKFRETVVYSDWCLSDTLSVRVDTLQGN